MERLSKKAIMSDLEIMVKANEVRFWIMHA